MKQFVLRAQLGVLLQKWSDVANYITYIMNSELWKEKC